MTVVELRAHLNDIYGLDREWPKTFEVDAETYVSVFQEIVRNLLEIHDCYHMATYIVIEMKFGKIENGLMYKGVELILRKQ